jgi:hypothetical protein
MVVTINTATPNPCERNLLIPFLLAGKNRATVVKRGPIFLIILLSVFSFVPKGQESPLSNPLSIASQDEHEHESFPVRYEIFRAGYGKIGNTRSREP